MTDVDYLDKQKRFSKSILHCSVKIDLNQKIFLLIQILFANSLNLYISIYKGEKRKKRIKEK